MVAVRSLFLLALIAGAAALKVDSSDSEWKERPVTKVVNLLKDISSELEAEAKADEEAYELQMCWCESNDKEKTAAISQAEKDIDTFKATIEEKSALSQKLRTDLETLKSELAKNDKALSEATEIRDKELAEFNQQDKDAIKAIGGLKGAIVTLSKHNAASLSQEAFLEVQSQIRHHVGRSHKGQLVLSLLQQQRSYAQTQGSGEIFGIMQAMKENFVSNQAKAADEEKKAATEFAQMKSAKEGEISAAEDKVGKKTSQLADSDEKHANAKTGLKDTSDQLEADSAFLADLKKKCASADQEYEARQKTRHEEIKAVSDTIGILTSDEAKDGFSASMGFVQTRSMSREREQASRMLRKAGLQFRSPQMLQLSSAARNDAFAKMRENIDALVAGLKQAQKDDNAKKDFCRAEFNENERQTAEKSDTKGDLEAKVAELASLIETLKEDLANIIKQIAEAQIQMKKASEHRAAESKEFSATISDQRATQAVLAKALDRLGQFYNKKALLEEDDDDSQEPMPTAAPYGKSKKTGGVMGMIQELVDDSRKLATEAQFDNHQSQMAYEEFMTDSNKMIHAARKETTDKTEQLAKAEEDHTRFSGDLKKTIEEILALGDYAQQMHGECDFLMKNYEARATARTEEVDALNQAKHIFA